MTKLCFVLATVALVIASIEAQSITSPFGSYSPYQTYRLRSNGFFNRNTYDRNYQQNYFRRTYQIPVNTAIPPQYARIISHNQVSRPNGVYEYVYETENGIRGQERGFPKQVQINKAAETVEGSYTYTSPEGLQVLVDYTADENGFHPQLSYAGVGASRFINSPAPASTFIRKQ